MGSPPQRPPSSPPSLGHSGHMGDRKHRGHRGERAQGRQGTQGRHRRQERKRRQGKHERQGSICNKIHYFSIVCNSLLFNSCNTMQYGEASPAMQEAILSLYLMSINLSSFCSHCLCVCQNLFCFLQTRRLWLTDPLTTWFYLIFLPFLKIISWSHFHQYFHHNFSNFKSQNHIFTNIFQLFWLWLYISNVFQLFILSMKTTVLNVFWIFDFGFGSNPFKGSFHLTPVSLFMRFSPTLKMNLQFILFYILYIYIAFLI